MERHRMWVPELVIKLLEHFFRIQAHSYRIRAQIAVPINAGLRPSAQIAFFQIDEQLSIDFRDFRDLAQGELSILARATKV
jgi:hypothetical protein